MTALVIDASVAVKWYIPETGSEAAQRLLDGEVKLFGPDLLFAEMAQTVWKREQRGEWPAGSGEALVRAMQALALESVPCRTLLPDALALAQRLRHSAYDCFYLALAVRLQAPLVTADRRMLALAAGEPALRERVLPLSAY